MNSSNSVLSVWEGNGKEILSEVWMGRKREGIFSFIFVKGNWKEMGRNLRALSKWEENGKEILNNFGVGGKWEGNNEFYFKEERINEGKY